MMTEDKKNMINQLKRTPIIQVCCEKTGIARATYYRWRKEDKVFSKKSEQALQEGLKLVNDMAESQLISAIKDRNITSILFWLRNRHPAYKTRLELNGTLGLQNEMLNPEQEALVLKALKYGFGESKDETGAKR
jgi:hypothetical protein